MELRLMRDYDADLQWKQSRTENVAFGNPLSVSVWAVAVVVGVGVPGSGKPGMLGGMEIRGRGGAPAELS